MLVDSEKTYSTFTEACAVSGETGCKLVEFIGENANGQDIKQLIDDAHDVRLLFTHKACIFNTPLLRLQ